MGAEEVVP